MSDDSGDENIYDEVKKLEAQIKHINQKIADLGIEPGDDASDLKEKELSATEIRAARRYTSMMHKLADEVQKHRDDDDDDDDDDGSSFKVEGTLK